MHGWMEWNRREVRQPRYLVLFGLTYVSWQYGLGDTCALGHNTNRKGDKTLW